ncbi:MAG: hypothetical protein AAF802_27340, partial [Planctomycetota bacterium]
MRSREGYVLRRYSSKGVPMRQMMYGSVSSVITVLLLGGCASDGTNLLTTASTPKSEAKAIVDPKCVTLLSRIEA